MESINAKVSGKKKEVMDSLCGSSKRFRNISHLIETGIDNVLKENGFDPEELEEVVK